MTSTTTPFAKPVILVGAGGHASVVLEALLLSGRTVVGAIALSPPDPARFRVPWLGTTLDGLQSGEVELALGVGSLGVGENNRRPLIFDDGVKRGFSWTRVQHPSAIVSSSVTVGSGVQVMAGAVVQSGAVLHDNVLINTRASVDHDSEIGTHTRLAPGVVLSGGVRIGARCHLGTGAVVIQGISVGDDAMVVAGATVTRDVTAGAIVRRYRK